MTRIATHRRQDVCSSQCQRHNRALPCVPKRLACLDMIKRHHAWPSVQLIKAGRIHRGVTLPRHQLGVRELRKVL